MKKINDYSVLVKVVGAGFKPAPTANANLLGGIHGHKKQKPENHIMKTQHRSWTTIGDNTQARHKRVAAAVPVSGKIVARGRMRSNFSRPCLSRATGSASKAPTRSMRRYFRKRWQPLIREK